MTCPNYFVIYETHLWPSDLVAPNNLLVSYSQVTSCPCIYTYIQTVSYFITPKIPFLYTVYSAIETPVTHTYFCQVFVLIKVAKAEPCIITGLTRGQQSKAQCSYLRAINNRLCVCVCVYEHLHACVYVRIYANMCECVSAHMPIACICECVWVYEVKMFLSTHSFLLSTMSSLHSQFSTHV